MTRGGLHDGFSSTNYQPVAETFFGFRAFTVNTRGRLCPSGAGVPPNVVDGGQPHTVYRGSLHGIWKSGYRWGAGFNTAECLRPARHNKLIGVYGPGGVRRTIEHQLMLPECDCGFWAYTNGEHLLSMSGGGPVALGIVEGWGRMVLGPHGFRAEKARIVALYLGGDVKPAKESHLPVRIDSAEAVMQDSVRRAMSVILTLFGVVVADAAARSRLLGRLLGKPRPYAGRPSRFAQGGVVATAPKNLGAVEATPRPWELLTDDLRDAVRRCYPAARIFDSVADMQREYPLSDLRGLLPGSAS